MKKINKNTKVISSIDTFQTKDKTTNRECRIDELPGQKKRYEVDGIITTQWSPNHGGIINKLSETEKEVKCMYKVATVISDKEIKMNRIDIHTDVDMLFEDIEKILDLLFISIIEGMKGNAKDWIDKKDNKRDAIWFGNQYCELNFYDKKKESESKGEKCEYPTRLEVRFKKIKSQDKKYHIDKAINMYQEVFEKLQYAENARIDILCKQWDKFIKENPKATLTHFVVANEKNIYTKRILEELYKHVGLKGAVSSWIKKFRQGYKLELITEKEIKDLVKKITISLKRYKNN